MNILLNTIRMLDGGETIICYVKPEGSDHYTAVVLGYNNGAYYVDGAYLSNYVDLYTLGVTSDMIDHLILNQNICVEMFTDIV